MNRAISGRLLVTGTGRPLPGMQVVVIRLFFGAAEVLGLCTAGDMGRFRVTYPPLDGPADLTLLVYSPEGRHLFTEPIHRSVLGAELRLEVEIPGEAIRYRLH